ncbi:MAG: hypothetical protein ACK4NP_00860 [Parvularculaceae bacterium]
MTPVRAVLAAVLAAIMVFAGTIIVARLYGREAADIIEILLAGPGPGLLCFIAAAGALILAALGVLTGFLAFLFREEDNDRQIRKRGFPKGLPLVLIVLSLTLVWIALRCGGAPEAAAPVAVPVAPDAPPAEDIETALEGGAPSTPPAPPALFFGETAFDWPYKDPLIQGGRAVWMTGARPFSEVGAAGFLCNKAWVAVTGSASEEGPPDRNAERARARALAAAEAARRWLARHRECGDTPVFAVDLGQHAPSAGDDTGAATAYQRRVLVIARDRANSGTMTAAAARADLAGQLSDPGTRAALFAGRRFPAEPVIIAP